MPTHLLLVQKASLPPECSYLLCDLIGQLERGGHICYH